MGEELSVFAKKRKSKKIIRAVFLSVLVLTLLGFGAYFALTRYFIVSEVRPQETSLYPGEAILERIGLEPGMPLCMVSKKEVSRAVEEAFPYLVNVKTEFDLPGSVVVSFEEKFGEFSVLLGEELYCVDPNLQVLAKEKPDSQIPRIRLLPGDISRCIVGESLTFFDEDAADTVTMIYRALKAEEMADQVRVLNLEDKFNIKIRYEDRFELLVGDRDDMQLKLKMVKEVIRDLGANERGIIDIADPNNAYVKLTETITESN